MTEEDDLNKLFKNLNDINQRFNIKKIESPFMKGP